MGTTAEKLSYLNGTKRLLRRRLNSLGANITLDTKFRDYLVWLDRFYDAASSSVDFEILGETTQEQYDMSDNLLENELQSQTISGVTITRNDDGTLVLNGTSTDFIELNINDNFELEAGTYCFIFLDVYPSDVYCWFNYNGGNMNINKLSTTKTFENDVVGIIRFTIPQGKTLNNFVIHPMVSEGSEVKDYVPYGAKPSPSNPSPIVNKTGNIIYTASDGTEFPIWLTYPDAHYNFVLGAIGDYKDRIYYKNGKFYCERKIKRVTLNGSENYTTGSLSGFYRFQTTLSISNKELPNEAILLSNNFKGISFNNRNTQTNETCFMSNGNLSFNTNVANSGNSFKTWLSTHPTVVYYILEEPLITEITEENGYELYTQLKAIIDHETKLEIEKKIF